MNNLQEQGRAGYKRGEYKKAIELFDRAIGRAPSVQLLDNRAACYEKLNDLQAALKDAKRAIQLQREDATGYLRAGKILLKMEKESVALEIYTHGMRSIKHVGQGFELLRKAERDLMTKLWPPTSVDPLSLLPRELAEAILEHLSFKQRMNAYLVSKQWAQFIRSCPDLWQHLDLSNTHRKVRNTFISRAINIARHKLTAATLNSLYDFDKTLAALVKHCPLQELTLLGNEFQTANLSQLLSAAKHLKSFTMSPRAEFPIRELPQILQQLSEHLELFSATVGFSPRLDLESVTCPKLRSLTIKYHYQRGTTRFFSGLSERMPSLESLTFWHEGSFDGVQEVVHLDRCPRLQHLDLMLPIESAVLLRLPPTLVSLRLFSTTFRRLVPFWRAPFAGFSLPNLEELSLEVPGMRSDDVQLLLSHGIGEGSESTKIPYSKLRNLAISNIVMSSTRPGEFLQHPRLNSLEQLGLFRAQNLGDRQVDEIVEALPKVRLLDLSETDITGVAVKKMVLSCDLKQLDVYNCRNIGYDAIEWARQQGVRVLYQVPEAKNGGRKVRH